MTTPLQTVQDVYTAFGSGDLQTLLGLMDDNVTWTTHSPRAAVPWAGRYHGVEGVKDFFSRVLTTSEIVEFAVDWMAGDGEHVAVRGHERVRAREGGKGYETAWAHLWTVRGGRVVSLEEFHDGLSVASAYAR